MTNFITQFPLKTEKYQEDILDKRFEIGRQIYNSLLNITQKRYKEMIKTKEYRSLISQLSSDKSKDKPIWKQINDIRKQFGMSEYSFYYDVKKLQYHFSKNIDSLTARSIASNLWRAYEKLFYGNGEKIHYKKYDSLNSLETNSNAQGIRFRDDRILWNGLEIPVVINYNNYYEYQALKSEIVYCRIIRKFVRKKYKYYVQITFKGTPPLKVDNETGEVKHYIGENVKELTLTKKYDENNYIKYHNFDAINVDKVSDIPYDYFGIMGVPITFIEKYNPNQFKIIGLDRLPYSIELGIGEMGEQWCNDFFSNGNKGHYTPTMRNLCLYENSQAKIRFSRILIQRKIDCEKQ